MIPLRHRSLRQDRQAFTLVEMLMVTAIIALLMTVAGNIMRIDGRAADVSAALDDLGGILHQARWEARSKSTYVWVCLKTLPGTDSGVQVVTLASRDGTSDCSPANLTPIAPSVLLPRVTLREAAEATPSRLASNYTAASVEPSNAARLGGSTLTITDSAQNSFSDHIVQFNPRGEASVPGNDLGGFIEVLFSPKTAGADIDTKTSSLLLSRATGGTQLYR